MKITIPGEPIPKARARFFNRQKWVKDKKTGKLIKKAVLCGVNSQSTLESEIKLRLKGASKECEKSLFNDSCEIHLVFYFRPSPGPDFHLKLWNLLPHIQKPDSDNLEKWIFDCCNKILYHDDCQLVYTSCKKYWSINPRTEISFVQHKPPVIHQTVNALTKLFSPEDLEVFYEDLKNLGQSIRSHSEVDNEIPNIGVLESTSYAMALFAIKYGERMAKLAKMSFKTRGEKSETA